MRVAKMAGGARPLMLPASALYRGEGVEERVRRLLHAAPANSDGTVRRLLSASAIALTAGVAAAALSPRISQLAHALLEAAVSFR